MVSNSKSLIYAFAVLLAALFFTGCEGEEGAVEEIPSLDELSEEKGVPVSAEQPNDDEGNLISAPPSQNIDASKDKPSLSSEKPKKPKPETTAPAQIYAVVHAGGTSDSTLSPLISWAASESENTAKYLLSLGTASGANDILSDQDVENNLNHQFTEQAFEECGRYFVSVKAQDADGNTSAATDNTVGFVFDQTAHGEPNGLLVSGTATVGSSKQLDWAGATDNCVGITYEMSIGLTAGAVDVATWTDVGDVSHHVLTGVTLSSDTDYFTNIRAKDASGLTGAVVSTAAWRLPGIPGPVTTHGIAARRVDEIEITWTTPFSNGSPIIDFFIEYKESSSETWIAFDDGLSTDINVTIDGLTDNTSYDFRLRNYNGSLSEWSTTISAETLVDVPFFESEVYKAMNLGGAEESAIVAFEDATEIKLNSVVMTTLNAGETHVFASALNDIIEADRPIFVAGRLGPNVSGAADKGNFVWSSPDWAGKEFLFNVNRMAPAIVTVYAFEDTAITISDGGVLVDSQTITEGSNHTFTITELGSYEMSATGLMIASMYANSGGLYYDPKPVLPKSKDIIGFPSASMDLTSGSDANNYNAYHSNSTLSTGTLTAGASKNIGPTGTRTLYQSNSLRIIADDDVIGASYADSNGYCSSPFLPVSMMRKRYAINVDADYVAFASVEGGTIDMIEPDGTVTTLELDRTEGEDNAPFKVRVGTTAAGTRFESTTRLGAWYQPNSNLGGGDEDETIMFGVD